jgi:hypothetical protein
LPFSHVLAPHDTWAVGSIEVNPGRPFRQRAGCIRQPRLLELQLRWSSVSLCERPSGFFGVGCDGRCCILWLALGLRLLAEERARRRDVHLQRWLHLQLGHINDQGDLELKPRTGLALLRASATLIVATAFRARSAAGWPPLAGFLRRGSVAVPFFRASWTGLASSGGFSSGARSGSKAWKQYTFTPSDSTTLQTCKTYTYILQVIISRSVVPVSLFSFIFYRVRAAAIGQLLWVWRNI